jgi:hypothetical protein
MFYVQTLIHDVPNSRSRDSPIGYPLQTIGEVLIFPIVDPDPQVGISAKPRTSRSCNYTVRVLFRPGGSSVGWVFELGTPPSGSRWSLLRC